MFNLSIIFSQIPKRPLTGRPQIYKNINQGSVFCLLAVLITAFNLYLTIISFGVLRQEKSDIMMSIFGVAIFYYLESIGYMWGGDVDIVVFGK